MRTLRGAGVGVIIIVAVALAGCSTPVIESRLNEYGDRAEEIHEGMLEHVPRNDAFEVHMTSQPQFDEPGVLRARERDSAFWTTWSEVEVATEATPAEAVDAAGAYLLGQRWTEDPTVDQGGTMPLVTGYRLAEPEGEWIVQIAWSSTDRRITLSVQSPLTVRGSTSRPE